MIVYAHLYESDAASKLAFERFMAWSKHELPTLCSAWRTRDPEASKWALIVADESPNEHSRSFDFGPGELEPMSLAQALAFAERRVSRIEAAYAAGKRERLVERISYGPASAPRVNQDGSITIPTPGRG